MIFKEDDRNIVSLFIQAYSMVLKVQGTCRFIA